MGLIRSSHSLRGKSMTFPTGPASSAPEQAFAPGKGPSRRPGAWMKLFNRLMLLGKKGGNLFNSMRLLNTSPTWWTLCSFPSEASVNAFPLCVGFALLTDTQVLNGYEKLQPPFPSISLLPKRQTRRNSPSTREDYKGWGVGAAGGKIPGNLVCGAGTGIPRNR